MQSIVENNHGLKLAVEGQLSDLLFDNGFRMVISDRYLTHKVLRENNCHFIREDFQIFNEDGCVIDEEELTAITLQLENEEDNEEEEDYLASLFDTQEGE